MCVSVCACVCISFSVILRYKVESRVFGETGFGFVSDSQPAVCQLRSTSASDCGGNQTSHPACEIRPIAQITDRPHCLHGVFNLR